MADRMEDSSPSLQRQPLDLDSIRRSVRELEELHRSCRDDVVETTPFSDSDMRDCALRLQSTVEQIVDEYSDVGLLGGEDSDAYLEYLRKELHVVEAESAKVSEEIERLSRTHVEDSSKLERELEGLLCSLDSMMSQELENAKMDLPANCSTYGEDISATTNASESHNFEILELENQMEEKKKILKSLQDLDSTLKRFDAVEQIEDALSGLKVIEFDGTFIRLSLKTYFPKLDGFVRKNKSDEITEPSELSHELLLEVMDRTMELKNVEMSPNDVYIDDIIDTTKAFREISSQSLVLDTRSSLEWFVGKVQERIISSSLRRFVVRKAETLRHSFEYFDRDETVVAHLLGGVDAFIKVPHGWPLLNTPLKFLSIKKSGNQSKEISLSVLCKVEELANSLDLHTQQDLSSFADAIEKILMEQMRLEIHTNETM